MYQIVFSADHEQFFRRIRLIVRGDAMVIVRFIRVPVEGSFNDTFIHFEGLDDGKQCATSRIARDLPSHTIDTPRSW